MARTARRAAGPADQKALDDSILEGVEGHHREPPPRAQHPLGGEEPRLQFGQLIVHGDPQGLKGPCGRMHPGAAPAAEGPLDHIGQVGGAGEGLGISGRVKRGSKKS